MSNVTYHAKVFTPTMKMKWHHFVFNCPGSVLDGSVDKWLAEKLEGYFWNTATNKPTQFEVREYGSIVGELKEIKP